MATAAARRASAGDGPDGLRAALAAAVVGAAIMLHLLTPALLERPVRDPLSGAVTALCRAVSAERGDTGQERGTPLPCAMCLAAGATATGAPQTQELALSVGAQIPVAPIALRWAALRPRRRAHRPRAPPGALPPARDTRGRGIRARARVGRTPRPGPARLAGQGAARRAV
jgi:hypothetical protein